MKRLLTAILTMAIFAIPAAALPNAIAFLADGSNAGNTIYHLDPNGVATARTLPSSLYFGALFDTTDDVLIVVQPDNTGTPIDDFQVSTIALDGTVSSTLVDAGATLGWTRCDHLAEIALGNGDRFILGWESEAPTGDETIFGFNFDGDFETTYKEHTFSGKHIGGVLPLTISGNRYVYVIFDDGSGKYASVPFTGFTDFSDIGGFSRTEGTIDGAVYDGFNVYVAGGPNLDTEFAMICGPHDGNVNPEDWTMEDVTTHVLPDVGDPWLTFTWSHGLMAVSGKVVAKGWGYYDGDDHCNPGSGNAPPTQAAWAKTNPTEDEATIQLHDCEYGVGISGGPGICGIDGDDQLWLPSGDQVDVYDFGMTTLEACYSISGVEIVRAWPVR